MRRVILLRKTHWLGHSRRGSRPQGKKGPTQIAANASYTFMLLEKMFSSSQKSVKFQYSLGFLIDWWPFSIHITKFVYSFTTHHRICLLILHPWKKTSFLQSERVKVLKVYFTLTVKFKTEIGISKKSNTNTLLSSMKTYMKLNSQKSHVARSKDNL